MIGAFLLGAILQVGVVVIKPIANIFELVPLTQKQWIYTILISFVPILIMEVQKKFNEFKFGKVVYGQGHVQGGGQGDGSLVHR